MQPWALFGLVLQLLFKFDCKLCDFLLCSLYNILSCLKLNRILLKIFSYLKERDFSLQLVHSSDACYSQSCPELGAGIVGTHGLECGRLPPRGHISKKLELGLPQEHSPVPLMWVHNQRAPEVLSQMPTIAPTLALAKCTHSCHAIGSAFSMQWMCMPFSTLGIVFLSKWSVSFCICVVNTVFICTCGKYLHLSCFFSWIVL